MALLISRFGKRAGIREVAHLHLATQNALPTHLSPTGTNIKAGETPYLCMKVFLVIKHYKLRPEIPPPFPAGEARVEEQSPSVTARREIARLWVLAVASACSAHWCDLWRSMESPPRPKGHSATCRPQTTRSPAQIHMEVIRAGRGLDLKRNPLQSATLILPAELEEKSQFPGV